MSTSKYFSVCVLVLLGSIHPVAAQTFPTQPVRIIVPYPPGGVLDLLARTFAQSHQAAWGQPIVVENRAGAGSRIGAVEVARSKDGHTILMTDSATITINPFLYKKLPYDAEKDFIPVSQLAGAQQMMLVNAELPIHDLAELKAYAQQSRTPLRYGSYGVGTLAQLVAEQVKYSLQVDIEHVPYRGSSDSIQAAIAGDVHFAFGAMNHSMPAIKAGKLRAIAIGGTARSQILPDVKTFAEQGYPDVSAEVWYGAFMPAPTPAVVVERVSRDLVAMVQGPDFQKQRLEPVGYSAVGSSPSEFASFLKQDREIRRRAIEIAGISPLD